MKKIVMCFLCLFSFNAYTSEIDWISTTISKIETKPINRSLLNKNLTSLKKTLGKYGTDVNIAIAYKFGIRMVMKNEGRIDKSKEVKTWATRFLIHN